MMLNAPPKDVMYEIINRVIKKHTKAAKRPVVAGRWVNKSRGDPTIRHLGIRVVSGQRANSMMRDIDKELRQSGYDADLRRFSPRRGPHPWSGEYIRMTVNF